MCRSPPPRRSTAGVTGVDSYRALVVRVLKCVDAQRRASADTASGARGALAVHVKGGVAPFGPRYLWFPARFYLAFMWPARSMKTDRRLPRVLVSVPPQARGSRYALTASWGRQSSYYSWTIMALS